MQDVSEVLQSIKVPTWPQPPGDLLIANLEMLLPEIHKLRFTSETYSLRDLHLNSPVARPSKIIGATVNYRLHQEEVNFGRGGQHEQRNRENRNLRTISQVRRFRSDLMMESGSDLRNAAPITKWS